MRYPSPERFARLARLTVPAALALLPLAAGAVDPLHPLGAVTLQQVIGRVIQLLLGFLGSLSLLMFIYGGFVWMTAAGNDEKIKKAKNIIVYSALGLIVAFSSFAILRFLLSDVFRGAIRT